MLTRRLLSMAAFAAAQCVIGLGLTLLNTSVAVVSPHAYALTGALWMLMPIAARVWTRMPGAAVLTTVITGLLILPFTVLGVLLTIALVVQAAVFDLVAWRSRSLSVTRLLIAGGLCGLVMGVMSFVVIDPTVVSPAFVAWLLVLRIVSGAAVAALGAVIATALTRRGLRAHPISGDAEPSRSTGTTRTR